MFNIVRRDPNFEKLFDLSREFGRYFDTDNTTGTWLPAVDIVETEEELRVICEVPGLEKGDFDLTLTNNVLTLTGEKKATTEEKGETFHRVERHYGKFTRSFNLPRDVDADKIAATHENGLLQIALPKSQEAMPHKIQIK